MMAMTETAPQPQPQMRGTGNRQGRQGRRRPFSALMKKLANFKGSSGDGSKLDSVKTPAVKKRHANKNNNPYPESGHITTNPIAPEESHYSVNTAARTDQTASGTSLEREESVTSIDDAPPTVRSRSMAPTVSTDHETWRSMNAPSHQASSVTGTNRTANGGIDSRRGGDSTFSSPAPSVRSLTTTLTTIHSMAANGVTNGHHPPAHHQSQPSGSQAIHFNQPFPTQSPASAIPAHLAPSGSTTGHPTTYQTATANNLLTDNASILTLASSSKRHRRRSFDTDASVRALAPSSLFGGSRESLPLSVLSANMDGTGVGPTTPGLHRGASSIANERTSIYSATGTAGLLASEHNSIYAKQGTGNLAGNADAASVRSGLFGHGRTDSVAGSIGGLGAAPTSPLASPKEYLGEREKEKMENGVADIDEEMSETGPDGVRDGERKEVQEKN